MPRVRPSLDPNDPVLTGGGSLGYNQTSKMTARREKGGAFAPHRSLVCRRASYDRFWHNRFEWSCDFRLSPDSDQTADFDPLLVDDLLEQIMNEEC